MATIDQLLKTRKRPPAFVPSDVNEQPWQTAVRQGNATNLDAYSRLRGSSRFAKQARRENYQLARQSQLPGAAPPAYVSPDQLAASYFGVEPGATPKTYAKQQVEVARDRARLAGAPGDVETERRVVAQPLDIAREQQDLAKQAQRDSQLLAERAQTEVETAGGAGRKSLAFEQGPSPFLESQIPALQAAMEAAYASGNTERGNALAKDIADLSNRNLRIRQGEAPDFPTGGGELFNPAPPPSTTTGAALETQAINTDRAVGAVLTQSGLGGMLDVDFATGLPKAGFQSPLADIGGDKGWPSEDTRSKMTAFMRSIEEALSMADKVDQDGTSDTKSRIQRLIFADPNYSRVKKWLSTKGERFWSAPWRNWFSGEDFDTMESDTKKLIQLVEG